MKKLLLGLGTLASVVAPITTVVACGTTSNPVTEEPSIPDNGNENPGTDQASVDDEQTRVNAFTSTGATQQNELVTTSTPFTTEIGLKYGLSVELHTDAFSYEYTSTVTGITIMVTKVSNESKPTVIPTEISVAPFVMVSDAEANANSITKEQIESKLNITVTDTMLPSQVSGLPSSINVIPTTDAEAIVVVNLMWATNDVDGSLTWTASIDDRTNADILTATIFGFKDEVTVKTENANSITKEQIEGQLTSVTADSTKFPSQVTGLPSSINVIPTTDAEAIVVVNLMWATNDVDGSLTWTASIDDRTNTDVLTATITGFKSESTITEANANSITKEQIENKINISGANSMLPSQVSGLPSSINVIPTTDAEAIVVVNLLWNANDVDGSLTWTASIDDRTNTDVLSATITGFKVSVDPAVIAAQENANSITKEQVEELLSHKIIPDSTKLPSQTLIDLPGIVQAHPTTDPSAIVIIALHWTTNDVDGSLTWTTAIGYRTLGELTATIFGFKDEATAKIENANSITKGQIENKLNITVTDTMLPSQVTGLPTSINVIPPVNTTITVEVALAWSTNDVDGSLTWTASIDNRTNGIILTSTITGFKDAAIVKIENANSITKAQVEAKLTTITPDSTKLPSQVTGLPNTIDITPTIDPTANVAVDLTWTRDDYAGSLTWTAAINDRDNDVLLTGTITGFKLIVRNSFEGEFSTLEKEKLFLAITDTVEYHFTQENLLTSISLLDAKIFTTYCFNLAPLTSLSLPKGMTFADNSFSNAHLTSLSLPEATTFERGAFSGSPLTSLFIPKVISIGQVVFSASLLTTLSLPEATTIGAYSFQNSPLTSLSAPKATSIGASAFKKIVNAASTIVTLPSSFNTDDQKNSIFGAGNWDQITFTWV